MTAARPRRVVRTRRSHLATAVVVLLLAGLAVAVSAAPARATPTPWSWTEVSASGIATAQGAFVTATCPAGYEALSGGFHYADQISSEQYDGRTYRVQAFDFGRHDRVDVTAWCARTDQVDLQYTERTVRTNQRTPSGPAGVGLADLACDGDRTPVGASTVWTVGSAQASFLQQSGPETIGGTDEWFVTAHSVTTSAVLSVGLLCVAHDDLAGATWHRQSSTAGDDDTTLTVASACPAQQRLVTGGEHVDSRNGQMSTSMPVDSRTWTSTADVPRHDTLTVSVLCVPDGDPVATITSGPVDHLTNTTTATFTFTAVDPSTGGPAHAYCFLNTSGLGTCAGSYVVTGLTEGENVFSVEAYTDDGRGWAATEQDYYFWVDLTRPTVTLAGPPLFSLGSTVSVRAAGKDNQAVGHYLFGVTARKASGADAATTAPVTTSSSTTTGTMSFAVKRGTSYRVTATAVDLAGHDSAPAGLYTAVPLDNLDLAASSGWSLISKSFYTNKLVSRTTTKGATLTRTMYGTTLGVVATTCPTCGRIGVYSGTRLLRTIDLHAGATHYAQVIAFHVSDASASMKVVVRVLSSNQLVEIDGLGAVVR